MATASETLAEFCTTFCWQDLPADVRTRAQELTLDLVGVAVRGSAEPSSGPVADLARSFRQDDGASVIGAGFCTSAPWAALANGTAAHAIEMDDVTRESSLHPGVAVIPAALAVAEQQQARPTVFLEAIVAGYEVTMRVGNALNPASAYARGFHPTGVAGAFGAAMAAGCALGLDAAQLTRSLGIAGSMASGSLEYLANGSWTKRLNAGWAAHTGVVAASLARAGFTSPDTIFEGSFGVLRAYSDEPKPDRLLADLGRPLQIMQVGVKPYGCCRYNHGLIDCVLALKREHGFCPEDVESIRLGVLSAGAALVADPIERKRAPVNVVDAQFSAPFASAVALAHGTAGPDAFCEATLADPAVQSLMARTDCYRDPSLDADFPARWPAAAEIRLRDGRTVSTRVEYATGEPENPVGRDALVEKFVALCTTLLSLDDARALALRILRLEDETDLGAVMRVLRGRAPKP